MFEQGRESGAGWPHQRIVSAHGHVEGDAGVLPEVPRVLSLHAPLAGVEVVAICNIQTHSLS